MHQRKLFGTGPGAILSGLTRLALVILMLPGIVAGAAVAGVVVVLCSPLLLLGGPARRTRSWAPSHLGLHLASRQSAGH